METSPTFQGCTPTLGGRSVIQDARHLLKRKRDEDVLQVKSLRFEPPKKREAKRRHERLESKSVVDRQPKEARRNDLPPEEVIIPGEDSATTSGERRGARVELRPPNRDIPCTVTAPCPPAPVASMSEGWRVDLLTGAALFRQQIAQLQAQIQILDAKATEWEEKAKNQKAE